MAEPAGRDPETDATSLEDELLPAELKAILARPDVASEKEGDAASRPGPTGTRKKTAGRFEARPASKQSRRVESEATSDLVETQAQPKPAEQSPPADKPGKKKKKRASLWGRFLLKLSLLGAILFGIFTWVLGIQIYHGNRMYPFVMDGDLLITYKLDAYHVGDVVAYRHPVSGKVELSRIVATGETELEITDMGALLINGYSPAEQVFYPTKPLESSQIAYPYHVTQGAYFLLDDYREIGLDSRAFGQISEEALLGKVVYVFRRRGI